MQEWHRAAGISPKSAPEYDRYYDFPHTREAVVIIPSALAKPRPATPRPPTVSDFGLGDDKTFSRRVEGVVNPLVQAQLVAKSDPADADSDSVIVKTITSFVTVSGQITDSGATNGVAAIQFELAPLDTAQLTTTSYYSISVTDSSGNLYILERGLMSASVPLPNADVRSSARGRTAFFDQGGLPIPVVIYPRTDIPAGAGGDLIIGKGLANSYLIDNAAKAPWMLLTESPEPLPGATRGLVYEKITDLTQGENYALTRTVGGPPTSGFAPITFIFTVRRAGTDPDAAAIVQRTISLTHDRTFPVSVSFTPAETALFTSALVWDARLVLWNGSISKQYTVAIGCINASGASASRPLPAKVSTMSIAAPGTITYIPTQLVLSMTGTDGAAINPRTRDVKWGSSNKAVATVSPTGRVSTVAAGSADITATCESVTARTTITVQAQVASVTVTPNPVANLAIGATQPLTVVAKDASGAVLTGRTALYTSSSPAIATVDASGLVTSASQGTASIVVIVENASSATAVSVPVPVASVTITPSPLAIAIGDTQQLTVVLKDAALNVLTGRTVTYHSDNTAVATVSSSGLVTAIANGTANITATAESIVSANDVVTASGPYGVAASPVAWWKRDTLAALSNGASVATWSDSGPARWAFTKDTGPVTYDTGVLGGSVKLDGSSHGVMLNSAFNALLDLAHVTIFAVAKWDAVGGGRALLGTGGFGVGFGYGSASFMFHYVGGSGASNSSSFPYTDVTNPHVFEEVYNGTQGTNAAKLILMTDGVQPSQSFGGSLPATTGHPAASGIALGQIYGDTTFAHVHVAEVLIFASSLSSGDRSTIRHALGTKYGITVT